MMDQATHQQKRIYASFLSQIDWTKSILVHKSHEKNWINFQNWIWRRNGSASFNLVFWILVVEILILVVNNNSTVYSHYLTWLDLEFSNPESAAGGIPDARRESWIHGSLGSRGVWDPSRESIPDSVPREWIPDGSLGWMLGWDDSQSGFWDSGYALLYEASIRYRNNPVSIEKKSVMTDGQTGHDCIPIYK